jgi:hypothetical protein
MHRCILECPLEIQFLPPVEEDLLEIIMDSTLPNTAVLLLIAVIGRVIMI